MINDDVTRPALIRQFTSLQDYTACWQEMKAFTRARTIHTPDEIWLLEHEQVFTLGIRENAGDIHDTGDIPLVKTDRGGLVTYHGPGQIVVYLMLDLRSLGIGLKKLVNTLEQATIDLLNEYEISASRLENAPGVYVDDRKIASIGLRVQRGCTYHGLSLNVDMDLSPYDRIIPCGLSGIKMTDMKTLGAVADPHRIGRQFVQVLSSRLGYNVVYENRSHNI
jgi:lipoyl(octanoyl) transferase